MGDKKVSKDLEDIFIGEEIHKVKVTATKVAWGEYVDYGLLEVKLSGDFGEVSDKAEMGDGQAIVEKRY